MTCRASGSSNGTTPRRPRAASRRCASRNRGDCPPRPHMHGSLLLILLVQIALILGLSRVMGWLFARAHQPQVVGEMVAGIMLGPSLFAWLAPTAWAHIFRPDLLPGSAIHTDPTQ